MVNHPVPAGHWPIDTRFSWVVVAGTSLHCAGCGQEGRAPLPRNGQAAYNVACLEWLKKHQGHEPGGGTR